MLELVRAYRTAAPGATLAGFVPALEQVMAAPYDQRPALSHRLLGDAFVAAWRDAADNDARFRAAQDAERDRGYFIPAVDQGISDGLGALGQFIYYGAMVQHDPGSDPISFGGIRAAAMKVARNPAQGGDETAYLNAFLDARRSALIKGGWENTDRVDTAQRVFRHRIINPPGRAAFGEPLPVSRPELQIYFFQYDRDDGGSVQLSLSGYERSVGVIVRGNGGSVSCSFSVARCSSVRVLEHHLRTLEVVGETPPLRCFLDLDDDSVLHLDVE